MLCCISDTAQLHMKRSSSSRHPLNQSHCACTEVYHASLSPDAVLLNVSSCLAAKQLSWIASAQDVAFERLHDAPLDTVLLSVASTVSCTAAFHEYAALSVT